MDEKLNDEIQTNSWPKLAKILLIIFVCLTIILIITLIIISVAYNNELNKDSSENNNSPNPHPIPPPQATQNFFYFGIKYSNLSYDEEGVIINSFKKGGENYYEEMGEINEGKNYEKNERNFYDLYIPQFALDRKDEKNGIILWIHGGAWIAGEKESMDFFCQLYAQQGYISATVGYTILDAHFKELNIYKILDEITASIKAIKKELIRQGFTGDLRLAIGGYSAGGHLSLLYSYLIKKFDILPIDFVINYVGPIGLRSNHFLKLVNENNTFENIEDINIINQALKDGKITPIYNDTVALVLMNLFYGNKFSMDEIISMLDEKGNIKEDDERYQQMLKVVKFSYITEIVDNHPDIPIICIYGGIDDVVGVSAYAYLKEKADKDKRHLDLFYSRYEGHMLIYPNTLEGIKTLWDAGSLTMSYLKKYFGY